MGLSGRKDKQRIPKDPRNLSWADDAARFGSNYLSKFGWDSSKGLGAGGDGMKSHIKVSHKLDMLGIGAGQQKDPNGIAWKQNKDFENLLKRLNENLAAEKEAAVQKDGELSKESSKGEKSKKRKYKDTEEETHAMKKKKTEVKVETSEQMSSITVETAEIVEEVSVGVKRLVVPRHRAHRARAIAAKNIASKSAAHISEILGVAPGLSTVTSSTSQGKLTSVTDTDALGMDKITTSTKSVADYFKDKLLLRSSGLSNAVAPSSSTLDEDDGREAPRMGLGAARFQMHTETKVEEETQRMGLSKFSSLMSSSFLASTSSFSSFVPPKLHNVAETAHISDADSEPSKGKKEKEKSKKRNKNVEEEDEVKEMDNKKKEKRDRKGKNKETPSNEEEARILGEKKKKSKRSTIDIPDEESMHSKPAEEETGSESRNKERRKNKTEKSEDDSKKLRKEKKKHRSSDEES